MTQAALPVRSRPRSRTGGRAVFCVLAAALAASACATLPPPMPARQAKAAGAYETAHAFTASAADWPADAWWRAYGDPQLDTLIDEALAGSPTMAQAQARVRKAEASTAVARSAMLPSLSANGTVQELKQSYNVGIPPAFVPKGYNDLGQVTLNFNW
jgi:outer membrane protein TolC